MNVKQGFWNRDIYKDYAKVGFVKNGFLGYLEYTIVLDKITLRFGNVKSRYKTAHNC